MKAEPIPSRKLIYFQPTSQVDNAGELLINLALLDLVRPYGEVILNDLRTPEWFIAEIAEGNDVRVSTIAGERFYRAFFKLLLKDRRSSSDVERILLYPPGHTARKGLRAAVIAFVWYLKLFVLKALGGRIVRVGFSIGPFDRLNALVESFGSRCFSCYGVRDSVSYAIGKTYRFANLGRFPDLAWTYRPRSDACQPDGGRPYVVLSFRSTTYGDEHDAEYLEPIIRHVEHLIRSTELGKYRLVIAYQVKSDLESSKQLAKALSPDFDVELRHEQLTLNDAETLYSGAHCVLTNRLHVLMLASQCRTVVIPVIRGADNVKITSILDDNMLSGYSVDTTASLAENVERLTRALERREAYRTLFNRASERNREVAERLILGLFTTGVPTEIRNA